MLIWGFCKEIRKYARMLPEVQQSIGEMVNILLIEVLTSIVGQERRTIHKRQREGIEAIGAKGKNLAGRKSKILKLEHRICPFEK